MELQPDTIYGFAVPGLAGTLVTGTVDFDKSSDEFWYVRSIPKGFPGWVRKAAVSAVLEAPDHDPDVVVDIADSSSN